MIIADCLPRQFRHRYTEPFIKQFIVCAVAVSGRLKHWSGEEIAHSTGECLALYAIIEKATSSLILADKETGKTIEEDPYLDFKNFERLAFVDGDYTSLFDPSLENIEDDEMADFKGMSLRLKDWFIPIYEDPAHPYLSGAGLPDGEEDSEEDLD
ncbi:MAG TPA: hypothetical protein VMW83_02765 [Spirochaetia bacterium]|nr:hypothetical protein [Spirochaetia bacterium]